MEGQRVHEYTVEQSEMGLPVARIGRVHNLVTFVREGASKLHYLDGAWVDDGKNPVPDSDVPAELRAQVEKLPFKAAHESGADVMVFCEFCTSDQAMPSREYAKHLANVHVRKAVPPPATEVVEAEVVEEELEADGFVHDENGEVVLNKDGTPRKKAGRPRKE